jgi:hypothetical protein
MIYDSTPAYLKPPLQICVPPLHKAMSPNVTGDMVRMVRFAKKQTNKNKTSIHSSTTTNAVLIQKCVLIFQ